MSDQVTIATGDLRRLAAAALTAAGAQAAQAAATAEVLVESDLLGITTHGVQRLATYCQRLRQGGIKAAAQITVERKAPSLALVDGDSALGQAVALTALESGLEMAAETGIAYVGCRNSNHLGALAPYGLKACEKGFLLVGGSNAASTMAPWGGREARLGNNPLAVAAPCPEAPHFLLDMAMSVAARGKVRRAEREGRPIPEGWALDAEGRPTTDPAAALAGFLLPFGGHKGSGLSQAVDLLAGVVTGARFLTDLSSGIGHLDRPSGSGHFFLLIDPKRLLGAGAYAAAVSRFRALVQETPPADPAAPVRIPGQRQQAQRAKALRDGIELPQDLLARLEALAAGAPD
ncbi:Ldh family oxidoreductase [Pelagibius marinus]|uniref:Ldh family oxidoreductase n=1 Tax=Pelagibius marinus TaxID=2762760 RepID=UPI001872F1B3|nr:Ldh family oxidoreductase [Pelagibius marinus]